MVNLGAISTAVLSVLSKFSPKECQPTTIGGVRFVFSLFFLFALTQHGVIADNGRLGFICHPETNDVHEEECFSHYSDEMNPFMRLYHFLLVTAFILVPLWTAMIQYSSIHLPKITRATDSNEKECLCLEFWKMFLLHVVSEAVALSVILGFFCYTQKIHVPKTYNYTLIAPVTTCRDLYHQDKSVLNIFFIGGILFILFLCIATVYQAVCSKENFIKELLVLNTRENKAVAPVGHKIWNIDVAQVPDVICQDLANDVSLDWKKLGRQLGTSNAHLKNFDLENHDVHEKITAMLNEWRERVGEKATAEVLGEALKEIERKDLSAKVKMSFTTAVDYLLGLFQPEAQLVSGGERFWCSLIIFQIVAILDKMADNGRLDFRCDPEINDVLTQECFSRYSAEMRSFIDPCFFLTIIAGTLFVSWGAIILYTSKHLPKIRKTVYREKEHLCRDFWKTFLLHVCCEAVVIAVLLVRFCYAQKIYFVENSYNCNALVETAVTCRDAHHWDKANLIIVVIGGMALIFLLCIWKILYAICKEEEFIKDLLDLTTGRKKRKRWTHEEDVMVMECYYKSKISGDSGYMPRMRALWIGEGMSDLPKDLLRRRVHLILRNKVLHKSELKQIRDRVGFSRREKARSVRGLSYLLEAL